jgi:transposase-like protein
MNKSRYTEEQIIGILKQHEAGVKAAELCREHGISEATFYKWKVKVQTGRADFGLSDGDSRSIQAGAGRGRGGRRQNQHREGVGTPSIALGDWNLPLDMPRRPNAKTAEAVGRAGQQWRRPTTSLNAIRNREFHANTPLGTRSHCPRGSHSSDVGAIAELDECRYRALKAKLAEETK